MSDEMIIWPEKEDTPIPDPLQDELRIYWNDDPADYPYLRESVLRCSNRQGHPPTTRFKSRGALVGYAILKPDAKSVNGWPGGFNRRIWTIKPHDRGYPGNQSEEDKNVYPEGHYPCEAVNPMSIRVGFPSRPPQDNSADEEIEVIVELIPPKDRYSSSYEWVVKNCPYCGQRHTHGAGKDPEKVESFLGHRVAHCKAAIGRGYYLVIESLST